MFYLIENTCCKRSSIMGGVKLTNKKTTYLNIYKINIHVQNHERPQKTTLILTVILAWSRKQQHHQEKLHQTP